MKAIVIGSSIVAYINGKQYAREEKDLVKQNEIFKVLMNLDEENKDDVQEAIALFQRELTAEEKQIKAENKIKYEAAKAQLDILDFMKDVRDNGHELFEVKENSIYLKGVNISMPELLVREMIKVSGQDSLEEVERLWALKNFWYLCALNPDPRARHDLFKFLHNHNLTLTPSGNFVAYRTVVEKDVTNFELEKFVTQEAIKITKKWKKALSNYDVYFNITDGTYHVALSGSLDKEDETIEILGNMKYLFSNIGEVSQNVYTDNHTKTFEIKIGQKVWMDRQKVDPDNKNSCSAGLHAGNLSFMKANMGYFGKVGIVVLINPKNVTSVPEYDNGKLRTCEYLPVAIANLDDSGNIKDVDIDVFDLELAENTQEELEAISKLSGAALEEYKKNEFFASELDIESLRKIHKAVGLTIEEAKEIMTKRVVEI